jgi:hypothetical protein
VASDPRALRLCYYYKVATFNKIVIAGWWRTSTISSSIVVYRQVFSELAPPPCEGHVEAPGNISNGSDGVTSSCFFKVGSAMNNEMIGK